METKRTTMISFARVQVLTTMLTKIQIIRDVTPCRLVNSYQSSRSVVPTPSGSSSPRRVVGLFDIDHGSNSLLRKVVNYLPWLRWLVADISPWTSRLDPGLSRVGFVVDKVALGQISLSVPQLSPLSIIPAVHRSRRYPQTSRNTKTNERRLEPSKKGIIFPTLRIIKIKNFFHISFFSRRPLTAAARIRALDSPCGFCGKGNETGTGLSSSTSGLPY
jgi:hypothetical protein